MITEKSPLDRFNDALRTEVAWMRAQYGCNQMQSDPHQDLSLGPIPANTTERFTMPLVGAQVKAEFIYSNRATALAKAISWAREVDAMSGGRTMSMIGGTIDTSILEAELATLTGEPATIPDTPEVVARKAQVRAYAEGRVNHGAIARSIVNISLTKLGIEPLPGKKAYKFEVPVVAPQTATYSITAKSEDEARAKLTKQLEEDRKAGKAVGKVSTYVPAPDAVATVLSASDVD